jgi:aminocarboxymuconate-semialdehyde decarboxylase
VSPPDAPATTCTIDVHAHLVPRGLLADLAAGRERFPHVEVTPHDNSHTVSFAGGAPTRPVAPGLSDPDRRTAWLDEQRIERQVVGGWLDLFGYDLAPEEGADWAELMTGAIHDTARTDPRLIGLGTVPLQDPKRAAEAVRSVRSLGLPGIMIATRAGGRELDSTELTPFWEAVDDTSCVVYLHPGFGGASDRYQSFGLVNGLARLEDTTVTLARLLHAGIPASYPGARIVVAHGGAGLPYVLGRLARNHVITPGTADPLESFAALFFDSVVFDADALEFLVAKVGAGRVLLGSDYPFPIGDLAPRDVVERASLDADARTRILGGSAQELFTGGEGA